MAAEGERDVLDPAAPFPEVVLTAVDHTAEEAAGTATPRPAGPPDAGRRGSWFGVLLGLALLAAGAGAWMLGAPPERAGTRLLPPNKPVNAGAMQPSDISANNSPTLARNPADPGNLVVSNRIDLPRFSCALHASFDAAVSWQRIEVPFPAGEEDPPRCYAPDVAYAPDGTLHMSFVTLKGVGNVPNAVWVVSSKDGGRTLSTPVRAAGPLAFQVQLTADPVDSNRLYLSWLQAEATGTLLFPNTGNPIVTATSIDAGATWSAPAEVSSPSRERVVAPAPAMGPGGELYVLYLDLLDDRLDYGGAHEGQGGPPHEGKWALVLARSTDKGRTWQETLVDAEIVPTQRFIVFLPPTPSLAVDPESGRVYVAFTDGRLGDADVHLWTSADRGRTFGPPVRVNDTPPRDGTSQYLPRLDVAPGGRLDVVYFDRRGDPDNLFNEVSIQSSFNGGRTFTRRTAMSDKRFDSRVGPGSERGLPDMGNRLALVSTAGRALAVWPDTRGGSEITSKQDLASAVVAIPEPVESRTWLRVLGAAVAALGLVSLILTLRSMRSAAPAGGAPRRRRSPPPVAPPGDGAGRPGDADRTVGRQPDADAPVEAPAPVAAEPAVPASAPDAGAPAAAPVPGAAASPSSAGTPTGAGDRSPHIEDSGSRPAASPPPSSEPARLGDQDSPLAVPDPTADSAPDRVKLFVREPAQPSQAPPSVTNPELAGPRPSAPPGSPAPPQPPAPPVFRSPPAPPAPPAAPEPPAAPARSESAPSTFRAPPAPPGPPAGPALPERGPEAPTPSAPEDPLGAEGAVGTEGAKAASSPPPPPTAEPLVAPADARPAAPQPPAPPSPPEPPTSPRTTIWGSPVDVSDPDRPPGREGAPRSPGRAEPDSPSSERP